MSQIAIHVGGTFEDTKRRVLDAVGRAERGERVGETHLTFESWEALVAVLDTDRLALLRHLHRNPETSVTALARNLGRDEETVRADVDALAAAGLIELSDAGLTADYDVIEARVAL